MKNPLHIAICDDSLSDAARLRTFVEQSGIAAVCEIFESGEKLLHSFCGATYDIIFMDIYMKGLRGTQAVEQIRVLDETVLIAFTTISTDHALESYRLNALKYIEKPVTLEPVLALLEFAMMMRRTRPSITLLIGGRDKEIFLDDILYIEQSNLTALINTQDGVYRTSQSVKLDHIEAKLSSPSFIRCHHSFIVNLRYVEGLNQELMLFMMNNGDKAYIRRGDLKRAKDAYETYLFASTRGHNS